MSAWLAIVVASLLIPDEAGGSRAVTLGVIAACAAIWGGGAAAIRGRSRLPRSWVDRAKRPLSPTQLLVLGAAVGPILSYFFLACLRVLAYGPGDDAHDPDGDGTRRRESGASRLEDL